MYASMRLLTMAPVAPLAATTLPQALRILLNVKCGRSVVYSSSSLIVQDEIQVLIDQVLQDMTALDALRAERERLHVARTDLYKIVKLHWPKFSGLERYQIATDLHAEVGRMAPLRAEPVQFKNQVKGNAMCNKQLQSKLSAALEADLKTLDALVADNLSPV